MRRLLVIFIHGYSVSGTETYGQLPERLVAEARRYGLSLEFTDLYLTRYISLNDQVRIGDLASALEMALKTEIYRKYTGQRHVCITHSTGGPLVRSWLDLFYPAGKNCPLSHLIMLAPANHGSALAQLGKSKVARIRAWFNGTEPGEKVLDWLELGSSDSWQLNKQEIAQQTAFADNGVYRFVITGQDIDRKLYDHINSYTGEPGTDGVVRVASANLNDGWLKIVQQAGEQGDPFLFSLEAHGQVDHIPFRIVRQKSHSGGEMGIMRSVSGNPDDGKSAETVNALLRCISVNNGSDYSDLAEQFIKETAAVQHNSLIETEQKLHGTRHYLHDRHSMVIFRLRDSEGYAVTDFDLLLTTGEANDEDALPPGFCKDRQLNSRDGATLTYYLNYDVLTGCPPVVNQSGKMIRAAQPGIRSLGLKVIARPDSGLVRYLPAVLPASESHLHLLLKPNATTLVEIVLRRIVSTDVLTIEKFRKPGISGEDGTGEFKIS